MNVTSTQIDMVLSQVQKIESGASGQAMSLYQATRDVTVAVRADRSPFREKMKMLQDMGRIIDKIAALSVKHTEEGNRRVQLARAALRT